MLWEELPPWLRLPKTTRLGNKGFPDVACPDDVSKFEWEQEAGS